jgi:hypothetical protein
MPLTSPIAETFFELTPVFFRRAWGMTEKVSALPDSRSLAWPMPFVAGKKRPVTAGMNRLKKMAEQQADYGETRTASAYQKNAPCQKHQPKIL